MQVHNMLLTADHILPRITPHQSPESITPWTGLDHYLMSLEKFRHLGGVDLALPGHEEPIPRLSQRIIEIEAFHRGAPRQGARAVRRAARRTAEIAARRCSARSPATGGCSRSRRRRRTSSIWRGAGSSRSPTSRS